MDYAGLKVPYINQLTGEAREASIFVAALGASSYTYAEAQESEKLHFWIRGHIHAFDYFEGVPEMVVPDYVPRNIIRIMCPSRICAHGLLSPYKTRRISWMRQHNVHSD